MDVNGTRFHLLLGEADWARCRDDSRELSFSAGPATPLVGLGWDRETHEQTLRPLLFHFVAGATDRAPALEDRRGVARDRFDNWYWIDRDARTIRVKSAGTRSSTDFWPAPTEARATIPLATFRPTIEPSAARPVQLAGLAVTAHHYLIAGTINPSGFLLFDLHAGGPPQVLVWPKEVAFVPFDMAATRDGGVCVLDRVNSRYWLLDAAFRVRASEQQAALLTPPGLDDFQPLASDRPRQRPAVTFPMGVALALATPIPATDPIAIEALPDGTVLVLDRGGTGAGGRVFRFRVSRELGAPVSLHIEAVLVDGGSFSHRLIPHDFAVLSGDDSSAAGRLYVVPAEGNQAFTFAMREVAGMLSLDALMEYLPMRLFQGMGLVGSNGTVYYDHPGGFAPLVEQKRPRYTQHGVLTTPVFDGREPDCVWHRLVLDGRIPDGASVEVLSRCANDPTAVLQGEFCTEPALYRRQRGPELPFLGQAAIGDRDSYELLFQRAQGRYLQLQLRLTGNGRVSPRLRALRAWYPRFSYLEQYLPSAYREDSDSASFLERFLANPEGFFTALEDRIAGAHALLDVRSAPSEALEWLASWFGMALDPTWSEAHRRLLIRHAMDFFQFRGTTRGLRMALRLALDRVPDESIFSDAEDPRKTAVRIVERFRARSLPGVYAGDASELAGIELAPLEQRWTPEQRGESLERRWQDALSAAGLSSSGYPVRAPQDPQLAALWTSFSQRALGFVPLSTAADVAGWREFLTSRYRDIAALNAAYGSSSPSFSAVDLADGLPANGAPLRDWYQFESIFLRMQQTAHRFRVLIPAALGAESRAERAVLLERAARVVELEKPAHTTFDLRFYYALFRVGEARLGIDSLIDVGGRAPELMAPFVLGPTHLAEGYLAARPPGDAPERRVLGRDRLDA